MYIRVPLCAAVLVHAPATVPTIVLAARGEIQIISLVVVASVSDFLRQPEVLSYTIFLKLLEDVSEDTIAQEDVHEYVGNFFVDVDDPSVTTVLPGEFFEIVQVTRQVKGAVACGCSCYDGQPIGLANGSAPGWVVRYICIDVRFQDIVNPW
jgi:hypothetical protein